MSAYNPFCHDKNKIIILAFWGSWSHDRSYMTIGDVRSVEGVGLRLESIGFNVCVLYENGIYPGNKIRSIAYDEIVIANTLGFVFICGPLHAYGKANEFFAAFHEIPRIAVNVSKVPIDFAVEAHFDLIVWRDSADVRTFDNAMDPRAGEPVLKEEVRSGIGVCLVSDQGEYGEAGKLSTKVKELIYDALEKTRENSFDISTILGSRNIKDVELEFFRPELIITTRLHGSLFALGHETPVIAIDQIRGGAKVSRIVGDELGWPYTYKIDNLNLNEIIQSITKVRNINSERKQWFSLKTKMLSAAATDHMCSQIVNYLKYIGKYPTG